MHESLFWDRDILLDFLIVDGDQALNVCTDADVERIFETKVSTNESTFSYREYEDDFYGKKFCKVLFEYYALTTLHYFHKALLVHLMLKKRSTDFSAKKHCLGRVVECFTFIQSRTKKMVFVTSDSSY